MKRTNSFSSEILFSNNNNNSYRDNMFLSMKETLHHPLEKIKSKVLLNHFYIDKNQNDEKNNQINNKQISNSNQDNHQLLLINSENNEKINNNSMDINYNKNNFKYKNVRKSNYNYKNKENNNSEIVEYNTSPNTNLEDNIDKDKNIICENNNIYNNYFQNEKNAMNEIKNIALNIKYKINSFKISENNSKISIEQTHEKSNTTNFCNINNNNNNNNISNKIIPFEFIDYSFLDVSKNDKKRNNNNNNTNNNINTNINNIKIEINKNEKNKNEKKDTNEKVEKNENYDYRNYIKNTQNLKLSRPDGDIYAREMAFRKKKELKLEEMRKKEMEEELNELKFKPKINDISKKIAKNKTPIYKRLKEIEIEKNNKIKKIKENNQEIFYRNNNKNKFNEEDFNNWLISNENWNVKKNIKLNNIKKEIKNEEDLINEEFKYQPKINKNSDKIFKSNNNLSSIPVTERLCYSKEIKIREEAGQRKKNDEKLTFIPEINRDYPISDKYYDFMKKDQFQIYYQNLKNNNNN